MIYSNKTMTTEFKDKVIVCKCRNEFTFTAAEQEFYASKGLTEPKRCKDCRVKKKQEYSRIHDANQKYVKHDAPARAHNNEGRDRKFKKPWQQNRHNTHRSAGPKDVSTADLSDLGVPGPNGGREF